MKTIILWTLLTSLSLASSQFKSCAVSKELALSGLAEQISTTIESGFSSETNVEKGFFDFSFSESKKTIKSKSKLSLSQVEYTKTDDKVCASISQEQLIIIAKGKIKEIKFFNLENLPEDEIQSIYYLNERLDEIKQAKAISSVFPDAFDEQSISLLEEKYKIFLKERSLRHAQKVNFVIKPDHATLYLDGIKQTTHHDIYVKAQMHTYKIKAENYEDYTGSFELKKNQNKMINLDIAHHHYPLVTIVINEEAELKVDDKVVKANQELALSAGKHHYYISSKSFCPIEGEFTVGLGTKKTINISPEISRFAQVTINSNQKNAKLTIDGKAYTLGKAKEFKSCKSEEQSFRVQFEKKVVTKVVTIKPGVIRTIDVDFLSNTDKKLLTDVADVYKNHNRLVARVGLDNYEVETLTTYSASYLWQKDWLRHGFGFDYGEGEIVSSYSAHYSLGIQLTNLGSQQIPFHIGNFALIPYIGVQGGGTHRNFATKENAMYVKFDTSVDLAINTSISVQLFYQKNFYLEKESRIGLGLSFKSPW